MKPLFKPAIWIVLGLAVILAGCEGFSSAPPITLRIGVFASQDFLPYFVMQEQGFDKKNGLKFEEISKLILQSPLETAWILVCRVFSRAKLVARYGRRA